LSCNLGEVTWTKPRASVSVHIFSKRTRPEVERTTRESPETAAAADPGDAAAAVTVAVTVSIAGGMFLSLHLLVAP
jgi:hypothetical protein